MIVTPHREDPFLSIRNFDDFFVAVQQSLRDRLDEQPHATSQSIRTTDLGSNAGTAGFIGSAAIAQVAQIVSLSVPLYGVDPLKALDAIATANEEYFYWENGRRGEAIAAIGNVAGMHVGGGDRMARAKRFIRQCFAQTLTIGDVDCPFAGARFFCRFTFFDQPSSSGQSGFSQQDIEIPYRANVDADRFGDAEPTSLRESDWESLDSEAYSFPSSSCPEFAFAPASLILPQWQVASRGSLGSFVANLPLTSKTDLRAACTQIWTTFNRVRSLTDRRRSHRTPAQIQRLRGWHSGEHLSDPSGEHLSEHLSERLSEHLGKSERESEPSAQIPHLSTQERVHVEQSVQAVLDAIQTHELSKAVMAHKLDVSLANPLHIPTVIQTLRQIHADCYLFATQNQHGQTFLGASPERLLSVHRGELTTEAIAGSAPRGDTPSEDARLANRLLSSLKEQHEHQLVVDFISQQLEALGLKTQRSPFPCLLQLSNIQHLQTPIYAQLSENLHPLDLVAALHPTPAVAGVPRQRACDYIRRYESFERSLYAAPFGWVDAQGNSEFLVGIRSALLDGNHARLYAGAGIVQGSDPAQELAEIELKLRALFSTLIQPNL
ncbi:MAG: isochorismate synthase [Elainellaceae cyanobacterium]